MMTAELRLYTDPACERSWALEPKLRRLLWEFGDGLAIRPVMAGLARTIEPGARQRWVGAWLEAAGASGMPFDPRAWFENPIASTYPACQAAIAAREQGAEAGLRYLRRLREGILCERAKLDHADALVAAAGSAGLDRDRFEIDLRSHAITEAFGADLDLARADDAPPPGTAVFEGPGAERMALTAESPYETWRQAAVAAGAGPAENRPAEPLEAITRFGRCATIELVELSGRPRPLIEAELWTLAREWRLQRTGVLIDAFWELP